MFVLLVAAAVAGAALGPLTGHSGAMADVSAAALKAAETAVSLAIGLAGIMALFLGVMKVAEQAGAVRALGRVLAPVLGRLFPDVPPTHPAMGAMVMNVAANILGLGNAATPFGIRAMEHLHRLNPHPTSASNAQVLFLALNTASVTLLPSSVIALRAASGSANPAAVVVPTLIATAISAVVAVLAARLLQPLFPVRPSPDDVGDPAAVCHDADVSPADTPPADTPPAACPVWVSLMVLAVLLAAVAVLVKWGAVAGPWIIPMLILLALLAGLWRRVPVYTVFVDGARDGIAIAIKVVPYLVAILMAVGMARASGVVDAVMAPLGRALAPLGIPAEAVMMAAMRTLSGSGSFGLLADYMKAPTIGPDSLTGVLLGTIYGSSETTFYVLAVYFGAVGIRRIRHALAAGLIADLAGLVAAVIACRWLYDGAM